MREMNEMFKEVLVEVWLHQKDLFTKEIDTPSETEGDTMSSGRYGGVRTHSPWTWV
jgi:hypothetical protein